MTAQINSFQAPQRLNVVKRDTRTIEEIERDMKLRRAKANGSLSSSGGGKEGASSSKAAPTMTSRVKAEPEADRGGRAAKDRMPQRRPRSPSESPEDSDDYTSSEEERPRKRSRPRAHSSGLREDQRSAIWKLMGRDRNRDLERERALGSDDSDMEATGEDVLREERQACVFYRQTLTRCRRMVSLTLFRCTQGPNGCTRGCSRVGSRTQARRREGSEEARLNREIEPLLFCIDSRCLQSAYGPVLLPVVLNKQAHSQVIESGLVVELGGPALHLRGHLGLCGGVASEVGRDLRHRRLGDLLLEVVAAHINESVLRSRSEQPRKHGNAQELLVGIAEEGDGGTGLAGTTGTSDTMNVCLDRARHLEIDDERDVRDVDTTSGQVGRNEDVVLARPDRVERCLALLLVLARVQSDGVPL